MKLLTATATADGETIVVELHGEIETGSLVIRDTRGVLITLGARRLTALINALTGLRALIGWREEREARDGQR